MHMNRDNKISLDKIIKGVSTQSSSLPNEQSAVMIYGNLKIRDVDNNEILINKRF